MPVAYRYQSDDHTIRVTCSEELNIQEVMQYFQDIENDDSLPTGTVELVDLTKVSNISFSHTDAASMPNAYSPAHLKRQIVGTIIFGASPINLGFSQLIEAYFKRSMPNHFFKSVKTAADAENILHNIRSN